MDYTVYISRETDEDEIQIAVDVELKMTYKGHPTVLPSLNYPGDPPEPPEFDLIKMVALEGITLTQEEQDKAYDLAVEAACEDMWNDKGSDYED
jgi:hypothetical protein